MKTLFLLLVLFIAGCSTTSGPSKGPEQKELTKEQKEQIQNQYNLTIVEQHFEQCVTILTIIEKVEGYPPMKEEVAMRCFDLVSKKFPQILKLSEADKFYLQARFKSILNSVRW